MKIRDDLNYISWLCILFFSMISCSKDISNSTYYFINNNELTAINLENDTLFEYKCEANFKCNTEAHKSYKIIKSKEENNMLLLAVERTNFVANASKEMKENRFSIIGITLESPLKIKFIHENKQYNEREIAKLPFELGLINNKFGFTLYEEEFLKSLPTVIELDEKTYHGIMDVLQYKYDELIENYNNTQVRDVYRTGILAEVIVRELVQRNLSPVNFQELFEKAQKTFE